MIGYVPSPDDKYGQYLYKTLQGLASTPLNRNATECANDRLTRLSLKLLMERKHPLFQAGVPKPLPTDVKEGWVFSGTTGLALDLYSALKGYEGREFITTQEAKRLGIDHHVRDFFNVSFHDKYRAKTSDETRSLGNVTTAEYVNIDAFSKNKEIMRTFFPEHEMHVERWKTYTRDKVSIFNQNRQSERYNEVVNQSNIDASSSVLPKYTRSLKRYEFCRLTGQTYTPEFSQEEILKEVAAAFQNHPKEARRAFQQSSYHTENFIRKLFTNEMVSGQENTLQPQQGLTMVNAARRSTFIDPAQDKRQQEYVQRMLGNRERSHQFTSERSVTHGR